MYTYLLLSVLLCYCIIFDSLIENSLNSLKFLLLKRRLVLIKMLEFEDTSIFSTFHQIFSMKIHFIRSIRRKVSGKGWLKIQKNEKQIYEFNIETINNKNLALKNEILEHLHQIKCLKNLHHFL